MHALYMYQIRRCHTTLKLFEMIVKHTLRKRRPRIDQVCIQQFFFSMKGFNYLVKSGLRTYFITHLPK